MNELLSFGIFSLREGFRKKSFSAEQVIRAYLEQIDKTKDLNSYILVTAERALKSARESDSKIASGQERPLEGIPISVKDVFCTKDVKTTAASKMLHNFVPPYESTVTDKMWQSGAVMLGKNNLDEFCMGSTTTSVFSGPVRNPWNTQCTAGGSSGGGAAAVASKSALCAVGTDTGGSVRQPAAFCGVVGIRPTYGRCSRWGIAAFSSSFDQASVMARSIEDAAVLLEIISGHDAKDSTSSVLPVPPFHKSIGRSVKGLKVGIPKEWYQQGKDEAMMELWDKGKELFIQAGCEVDFVSLPYTTYALPCYYILTCAEAASNLQRYDGVKYGLRASADTLEEMYDLTRGQGFGPEVKRRILIGTYVLSEGYYDAYYGKAQKVRLLIEQDFKNAFQKVDVLLAPTTPTPAFPLNDIPDDPVTVYFNDILTVPINVGGVTGISVPAGLSKAGLPLGLQLIAPPFHEETLFQFGSVIERNVSFPQLII
jgi:aspartyl-tRNA(Asn)/glutamyl-tRNA(Gln) amidotransferase subunit A